MRWELLDRFDFIRKGESARAVKSFDGCEDFFAENFPGNPIVPEPLFIEMIAQCGGVLYGFGLDFKKEVVLAKIDGAKFSQDVPAPCILFVEAEVVNESESGARVRGSVACCGRTVAEAEILLVAVDKLDEKTKIVFNDKFLKHYDVYNVARKSEALT